MATISKCTKIYIDLKKCLSLSSIQFNLIKFNMCFIGMTIVTMYCQSIVFTLNLEQIYMQQKHACIYKVEQINILEFYEQFKIQCGVCVCVCVVHSSHVSGSVPSSLKTAIILPLLRNRGLIHQILKIFIQFLICHSFLKFWKNVLQLKFTIISPIINWLSNFNPAFILTIIQRLLLLKLLMICYWQQILVY